MMFYAGRRQPSAILIALFTFWVASPFAALALADLRSTAWQTPARRALYGVMLAVGIGSLAVYGVDAVRPFSPRAAAIFLAVPGATWLLSAIALGLVAMRSRAS